MDERLIGKRIIEIFWGLMPLGLVISGISYCSWVLYIHSIWGNPPIGVSLERIGIILQILAGGVTIPELFAQKSLKNFEKQLPINYNKLAEIRHNESWYSTTSFFELRIWFSILCLWSIFIFLFWRVLLSEGDMVPIWVMILLGTGGSVWTIFMEKWIVLFLSKMLSLLINLRLRRFLAIVTFPLLILGSILELISTFVH